jgi:hypothetical protein
MVIHWGWPSLLVLYNDAFIPLIGDKHPSALGQPLFKTWPELRVSMESTIEGVLTTGKSALSKARRANPAGMYDSIPVWNLRCPAMSYENVVLRFPRFQTFLARTLSITAIGSGFTEVQKL